MVRRRLAAVVVIAGMLGLAGGLVPPTAALLDPTLVAHWDFDEGSGSVANDTGATGGFPGAVVNATWSTDTPTGTGTSLLFNGTSSRVDAADAGTGSALDVNNITASAWIKMDPTISFASHNIVRKGITSDRTFGMDLQTSGASGLRLRTWVNSTNVAAGGATEDPGTANLRTAPYLGKWVHVAMTFDGSVVTGYINGVADGGSSVATVNNMYENNSSVRIGGDASAANFSGFKGLIDDVRIYSRALTPTEIANANDLTAPSVLCSAADAVWHGTDQSITCTASDGGSGLADAGQASFQLTTNVASGTHDPAASTGSVQVCDNAGNCSTAGPASFMVDKLAPPLQVDGVTQGGDYPSEPTVTCTTVADDGSPAGTCNVNVVPGPGTLRTATAQGSDDVGNSTTVVVTYTVTPPAPPASEDCGPAAPAIANKLLRDAGVRNRQTIDNAVSAVGRHMTQGAMFEGHSKCSAQYAPAVRAFLVANGWLPA